MQSAQKGPNILSIYSIPWWLPFSQPHNVACSLLSDYCMFWPALLGGSTSNKSINCMLSTSCKFVYEQRTLRFRTRLDHWLLQDGCQITASTETGSQYIMIHGLLITNNTLSLHYYEFLTFCYCTDPSDRRTTGTLSYPLGSVKRTLWGSELNIKACLPHPFHPF